MTDEDKRSCHTCIHQSYCHLHQNIHKRLVIAAGMFRGKSNPATDIFDTLAEACTQYQKTED